MRIVTNSRPWWGIITLALALVAFLTLDLLLTPTVLAKPINNDFDMNDRTATVDGPAGGSGTVTVNRNRVSFTIDVGGLTPNDDKYDLMVMIRASTTGTPVPPGEMMALISYDTPTDADGKISFEKKNFNLELLQPGEYRLDWMISHPDEVGPGRGATGMALRAATGRDILLACQPGTTITIP